MGIYKRILIKSEINKSKLIFLKMILKYNEQKHTFWLFIYYDNHLSKKILFIFIEFNNKNMQPKN